MNNAELDVIFGEDTNASADVTAETNTNATEMAVAAELKDMLSILNKSAAGFTPKETTKKAGAKVKLPTSEAERLLEIEKLNEKIDQEYAYHEKRIKEISYRALQQLQKERDLHLNNKWLKQYNEKLVALGEAERTVVSYI